MAKDDTISTGSVFAICGMFTLICLGGFAVIISEQWVQASKELIAKNGTMACKDVVCKCDCNRDSLPNYWYLNKTENFTWYIWNATPPIFDKIGGGWTYCKVD